VARFCGQLFTMGSGSKGRLEDFVNWFIEMLVLTMRELPGLVPGHSVSV
jgi:hypothetical protein